MKKYTVFYLVSLAILTALSAYPLWMGISTLCDYIANGAIEQTDYPKYLIPYAPICAALIISAALMPVFFKLFKRFSLLASSILGIGLFLLLEGFFEKIKVIIGYEAVPVESWQLALCMATPEVLEAIGEPIYAENDPSFKFHFYLIAIVIIVSVLGLINGYSRLTREGRTELKKPLIAQTISVTLFISLCVIACFTAFFRNGTLYISPISSLLTGAFFVILGITLGIYIASFLVGNKRIRIILPAVSASAATLLMYIGELLLMDGKLFIFGSGAFFSPLGAIPFSICDIMIILLSGLITALISAPLTKSKSF